MRLAFGKWLGVAIGDGLAGMCSAVLTSKRPDAGTPAGSGLFTDVCCTCESRSRAPCVAVASSLAAVAGVLVAMNYNIAQFAMGFMPGLKAFTAAVLGGIGNLAGAVVGGLLLGIIESLGAGYIGDLTNGFLGSHYQDIFAFVVLIGVLLLRPSGLLGERVADRA